MQELSQKIQVLGAPFSLDIEMPDPNGEKMVPAFTDGIQIVLNNGMVYSLKLVKLESGKMLASMDIQFFPKAMKQLYGETDEQFEIRKKQQTERFEFEKQAFQDKIFIVRNDLIDLLGSIPK